MAWLFYCSSNASAASIAWEPAGDAGSCSSANAFQSDLEGRLGRPLSEMPDAPQALRITIHRSGKTFIAHIELRNEAGTLVGERTLSVPGDRCRVIDPYLSLAVALMIDPKADLGEPAERVDAGATEPAGQPKTPEGSAEATAPSSLPAATETTFARLSGAGRAVVYVYPALRDGPEARHASSIALSQLAQRLLAQRLVEREIYRVVQPPAEFEDTLHAESWRRSALDRARPRALTGPSVFAPAAEYVLQPVITSLTVQDGLNYTRGAQLPLVTVTLKLALGGIDYLRHEELEGVEVSETVSVEGKRHDALAVGFAVRLAAGKATESLLGALRQEGAFRIRPRADPETKAMRLGSLRGVEDGDHFQFEDETGARSGWVVARDVSANHARPQIWKNGRGVRLVDVGKKSSGLLEISLRRAQRLGYEEASEAEREQAMSSARAPRALGRVSEYGIDWRFYAEPAGGSGLRPFAASNLSFLKGDSLAVGISAQGGVGYELRALPAIGLSLMPFAAVGPMLIEGWLGQRGVYTPLNNMVALSAGAGARLELYRLFGALSLSASAEFAYVAPLYSETASQVYLGDRYPSLNAFVLQLGGAYRSSDYPD